MKIGEQNGEHLLPFMKRRYKQKKIRIMVFQLGWSLGLKGLLPLKPTTNKLRKAKVCVRISIYTYMF